MVKKAVVFFQDATAMFFLIGENKMTDFEIIALSVGILVLILGIFLFIYIKYLYPKENEAMRIREQQKEEEYKRIFETEPEYIFKQAKIVDMRNHVSYLTNLANPAMPSKLDEYFVTFLNEDGEEKEYPVSQEFFYNVVKGEEGTLITVNGNFFDFGDGVDIIENEENIEEHN